MRDEISDALPYEVDGVRITDHAIVRFLERVHGLNLNEVRRQMTSNGVGELIRTLKSGRFPLGNGAKLVVQDSVVITVVGKVRREA